MPLPGRGKDSVRCFLGPQIPSQNFRCRDFHSSNFRSNSRRGGNSGHGALHQPRNYALRKKREADLELFLNSELCPGVTLCPKLPPFTLLLRGHEYYSRHN